MSALEVETDVVLRDGSTARVRPVRREDEVAMREFLGALSDDSRRLRFFSGGVNLDRAARDTVAVDGVHHFGVVALHGGRIVAHAEYVRFDEEWGEASFAVADDYQGHGLATTLLAHLAGVAESRGIHFFEAEVLPENHRMIGVFRDSGFSVRTRSEPGEIIVEFPTLLSPDAIERFELRERGAAVAALRSFLAPASVAVIGDRLERGSAGGELFHNLLAAEFHGPVYPVCATAEWVQSVPAYRSLADAPGPAELAVITLPAPAVLHAARACGAAGVRALVVISDGFAETPGDGPERQLELLRICREAGMRLVGPNCLGILNTAPGIRLDATLAPAMPPPGNVGFMSQSGALGLAAIDYARAAGLGMSSMVSAGNKADISGNDLIQYWEEDPDTRLVLLYLESFGNPRKFARIARRAARSKPILAVKSGRSGAGSRAVGSHTGAMLAASDVTVDALFRQAGVIRADTLAQLLDVARLLDAQAAPAGSRVAIATNAGGPGVLCADACTAAGLDVVELPAALREELAAILPPAASCANPVDMLASAGPEQYAAAVRAIAHHGAADAIVAIFVPPLGRPGGAVARALREAAAELRDGPTLAAVFMAQPAMPEELADGGLRVPAYAFPEDAAVALGHAARYTRWRARDPGQPAQLAGLRADEAAAVIAAALRGRAGWLEPEQVAQLLSCYGIAQPAWRLAGDPGAAGRAAVELDGPVAVKALAPSLERKSDAGGVRLDVRGAAAAERAAADAAAAVARAGHVAEGFVVQRMAEPGVEMIVGVVQDPLFGPVVACGGGGTAAELVGDAAVQITPLTDRDAAEMVRSLQTFPLLEGFRGAPPADVAALEDVILRVAAMVEAHPEIAELDLSPVVVGERGAVVLDARVLVREPPARRPWPSVD